MENDMKIRIDGAPWTSMDEYRLPGGGYRLPAYCEIQISGTLIVNDPLIFGDLEYRFQPCRHARKPRQTPPFWSAYKK